MTARLTRRRALRVLAAGMAMPLGVLALRTTRAAPVPVQWTGSTLGALSSMTLWHPRPQVARRALDRMVVEVTRLEGIFSLYRPDSELVRLNADGRLASPSRDLVDVLDKARTVAELSGGAFDPTIQPLWAFHAAGGLRAPDGAAHLRQALARVGYADMTVGPRAVRYGRPGMAASLNGIAQGHITDRITELLGNEGFDTAVIELGETRALGSAPGGAPFSIGLVDPLAPDRLATHVPLSNDSLSVSGGYGTVLADGASQHIFDPTTGDSPHRLAQVAVVSPRAVWADALSTAIYVAGAPAARRLLDAFPGSSALLWRGDGSTVAV